MLYFMFELMVQYSCLYLRCGAAYVLGDFDIERIVDSALFECQNCSQYLRVTKK